jgi:hypothetical protein
VSTDLSHSRGLIFHTHLILANADAIADAAAPLPLLSAPWMQQPCTATAFVRPVMVRQACRGLRAFGACVACITD